MTKRELKPLIRKAKKLNDIPATKEHLDHLRYELKSAIERLEARFDGVDAKFNQSDAKFKEIDAKFEQVDRRFDQVDARFVQLEMQIKSSFHRLEALMVGQEERNQYVLDGLENLFHRQDRLEERVDKLEESR